MIRVFAACLGLAVAACSPAGSVAQDAPNARVQNLQVLDTSEAGMTLIDVSVTSSEAVHIFKTEVAATQAQQARGMMFRTEMGDDEGMLFPSYQPQMRSFWMKNTPLALDIIFIGEDMRIMNIEAGVPYNTNSVYSAGLAIAVFEIRGGLSEELGIKPGDLVEFELPADAAL
ncbi:MAG: DUF192 domain-containing protein [Pseudomonadota bacterium]